MSGRRSPLGGAKAILTVAALTLLAPATADAAQRFASTTGSAVNPCTAAAPCDIETATNAAMSGDEVIVAPGTYTLGAAGSLNVGVGVNLHGATGGPRPLVTGSNSSGLLSVTGRAADLRLEQTSLGPNTSGVSVSGIAERLEVTSTAINACTVSAGGLLRDSFCIQSSANNGSALFSGSATVSSTAKARNVTAISTGGNSFGARMTTGFGGSGTLNLRNVIASGTIGDVRADTQNAGETSIVEVAYSNYDLPSTNGPGTQSIVPAGTTNQSAAPLFANAAGGDYRQAFGSPTINAGAADADTGTLDVDAEARPQGTAIDIGADEADGIAPETTIDSGPDGATTDTTPTFTYSGPGAISFTCTLDGIPEACSGPSFTPTAPLADGPHTFTVAGTDAFENTDATPATRTFTVAGPAPPDDVAPQTTIDGGPKKKTKSKNATFRFSADEAGVTFQCKLDKGGFTACSPPQKYKRLKKGKHTFSVRATDATGNVDASPATYAWTVKKKRRKR